MCNRPSIFPIFSRVVSFISIYLSYAATFSYGILHGYPSK